MSVVIMMMILFCLVVVAIGGRQRRHWDDRPSLRGGSHERLPRHEPGPSQEYVDTLETRIARLEERLDFTERLLQGRTGSDAPSTRSGGSPTEGAAGGPVSDRHPDARP